MRVGIISDTHNRLDERVHEAFAGVDRIIHAGDIGTMSILYELEAIAPVTAVLGNCDSPSMMPGVPSIAEIPIGGLRFRVTHDPRDLNVGDRCIDVFVHGHTHETRNDLIGGKAVINPGSATRPRGMSRRCVAVAEVSGGVLQRVDFVEL